MKNLAETSFVKESCFFHRRSKTEEFSGLDVCKTVFMGFESCGGTSHKIIGLTKFRVINILARKEHKKHTPICDSSAVLLY